MDLKNQFANDERAVSPVIGVILMVAITVILAAVIGTFVLNLGGNVNANPQAGVSFDQTASDDVRITISSMQSADEVNYSVDNGATWNSVGTSVGASVTTNTTFSDGDKVTVRATYQGEQAVIAEYTVNL